MIHSPDEEASSLEEETGDDGSGGGATGGGSGGGGGGGASPSGRIGMGSGSSCFLRTDGKVFCSGDNTYGQLGINKDSAAVASRTSPQDPVSKIQITPLQVTAFGKAGGGSNHRCALGSGGSVYCWGFNSAGELGDGAGDFYKNAVRVKDEAGTGFLTGMVAVATGSGHSCAIDGNDGSVLCWGFNIVLQLGVASPASSALPVRVRAPGGGAGFLTGMTQISAGSNHTCAVNAASGPVYCWGYNSSGELGTGVWNNSGESIPAPVLDTAGGPGTLADITQIAAAGAHTCALKGSTGEVFCWGDSANKQLGDGPATASSTIPVQVAGVSGGVLTGITSLVAGTYHTCGLDAVAGKAYCWGGNASGQLGDNTQNDSDHPVEVLDTDGVGPLLTITAIAAGSNQTCVVRGASGHVYCWGADTTGALGASGTGDSFIPVQVAGAGGSGVLSGITQVTVGNNFGCALNGTTQQIHCWGAGGNDELGSYSTFDSDYPLPVIAPVSPTELTGVTSVQSSTLHHCALTSGGEVYCWGMNSWAGTDSGSVGQPFHIRTVPAAVAIPNTTGTGNLTGITALAAGASYTCGLHGATGEVYCWGSNSVGALGNASNTDSNLPSKVLMQDETTPLSGMTAIAAGTGHACAANTTTGTLYCWGWNNYGQLGDGGVDTDHAVPVAGVGGAGTLTQVKAIAAGNYHTCAVAGATNAVYCWGYNDEGQLGDPSIGAGVSYVSGTPVATQAMGGGGALTGIAQLALGFSNSCGLDTSGAVFCWGGNSLGQIGNGTTGGTAPTPVQVSGEAGGTLSGIATIISSDEGSDATMCGTKADGSVTCWGAGSNYRRATASTLDSNIPVPVAALPSG